MVSRSRLRQPSGRRQPTSPEEGYHLTVDLTDKAIEFIQDAKAIAPDKPFFLYYCPGAAPRAAPRAEGVGGQVQGPVRHGLRGLPRARLRAPEGARASCPSGTELSPINPYADTTSHDGKPWPELDSVRPWDSLSDDEQRLFARMAEVYAGFLSHADHELGRLLDYLEESGQLDNTIIVLVSDNGASGEGGPNGSVNENKFFNGIPDTIEENLKYLDELGSPLTYNHYPTGWAWAFNTPFKMWKRYANYEGGTADPLIVSWPRGIERRRRDPHASTATRSTSCRRSTSALGVELPDVVNGYTQTPLEGVSFAATLRRRRRADAQGDAVLLDARHAGDLARGLEGGDRGARRHRSRGATSTSSAGSCSTPTTDPSECHDLAEQHPDKLQELIALWWAEAGKYQALPLESRGARRDPRRPSGRSSPSRATRYIYYPGRRRGARVGRAEHPQPLVHDRGRDATIDTPEAGGVLFSQGSRFGGHALYVKDGKLKYVYNWIGELVQIVESDEPIPTGHVVALRLVRARGRHGCRPQGTLTPPHPRRAGRRGHDPTQPGKFGLGGGGLVVGRVRRRAGHRRLPGRARRGRSSAARSSAS